MRGNEECTLANYGHCWRNPAMTEAGAEIIWGLLGDIGPRALLDEALAKIYRLGSTFQFL